MRASPACADNLAQSVQTVYLRLDHFVRNICRWLYILDRFCPSLVHHRTSNIVHYIVVIGRPGSTLCDPNVHIAKPWFFPCVKRKSELVSIPNSPQVFFVGCNVIFVVFLIKCGVVWQSVYTLDPTYLVQYTPDCKVDVELRSR